jgi:hypothetical protein
MQLMQAHPQQHLLQQQQMQELQVPLRHSSSSSNCTRQLSLTQQHQCRRHLQPCLHHHLLHHQQQQQQHTSIQRSRRHQSSGIQGAPHQQQASLQHQDQQRQPRQQQQQQQQQREGCRRHFRCALPSPL